mmetsp:Transcript_16291/g.47837  ORF Transcript_16291/g.47837 Transcript_16291/m.47837 type:complete len:553 (-) Transcript_16291:302-1960(-)
MYTGVLAAGRFWYPLTANPSWPAITPWVYTLNKLAKEEWFDWTRGARTPERAGDGGRLPAPEKVKTLFDRGDPESENATPWAQCLEEAGVTGPGVPPTGDSPPLWPAGPAPQNPRTNVLAMWTVNFFIATWFQSGVLTDGEHYTRNFSGDFDMGFVYGQTKEQQAFLMNKEDGTVRVNSSGRPLRYMDADNGPFSPESSDTLKFGKLKANVWASGSNHTNVHVGMYFMLACAQSVHNVLAVEIRKMHPEFDGPRIFESTKQLLTFLFFQVVRREYVGFLNGGTVREVNAQVAALNVPLNRYSPMVAGLNVAKHLKGDLFTGASAGLEYETSYMWHAMPPEELGPLGSYSEKWIAKPGNWTDAATGPTLRELLHAAQVAPSSLQTLGNTPSYLLNFEMKVVERSRGQRVGSFNQVRAAIHLPPITSFDQFAAPWDAKLAAVYEHPDDIDLYVGYNAPVKGEYDPERSFMTQSMFRMVSTLVYNIGVREQDCLRKVPRDVWARFKDMDLYSICATAIAADPASIAQPGPNKPLPPASYSDQGVNMFYPRVPTAV